MLGASQSVAAVAFSAQGASLENPDCCHAYTPTKLPVYCCQPPVMCCLVVGAGLSDLLSALPAGVLEELTLDSCRSVSRGARQAAVRGVVQLQEYLADAE